MPDTDSIKIRPSDHFGARLAARRERLGISLSDMAEMTNIRQDFIAAIERLDQDALPAVGYTLGYVKTYAKALGMDAGLAVKDYKASVELKRVPLSDAPHVIFRRHWRLPRGFVSALTVASGALMIGVWYGTQSEAIATAAPIPEIAPQYTALEPAAPTLQEGLYTLRALAPSWIQIRDGQGSVEVSRIFITGETWQGPRAAGYSATVRDAGAVEIYDGKTRIGTLGQPGEPLTGLPLSDAAFVPSAPLPDVTLEAALPGEDRAAQ